MTRYPTLLVAGLLLTATAAGVATHTATTAAAPWLTRGAPDIQVAGALTFTPDGLLLVGDSPGSAVFAIDVADRAISTPNADTVRIRAIDARIAARLGTTRDEILINDMAVHPRSHAIYLSVMRGRGVAQRPAIVRVDSRGKVDVVSLEDVAFAKAALPNPPRAGAKDEDGEEASAHTITGLAVARGAVYVAGLTNDEFSSTLRRIAIPFTPHVASTGLRIYHTHHSRFETKSPVTAIAPYSAKGRDYLLVSYGCTPLAIFPIDSLADGAKVTGKTIAELGAGTHATSLVSFPWQGKQYLAVATIGRSLQLLEADDLAAAPELTETDRPARHPLGSWFTWGVRAYPGAIPGVLRLADLDSSYTEALQRDVTTGSLDLRPLKKPILWDQW